MVPYHLSSNDEVEHLAEKIKLGINKADRKTASELDNAVIELLVKYRATPYTAMNISPSEMLKIYI